MRKLDRSKPFQELIGDDPDLNYRFMQDGVKYDNQGNEVVEKGKKAGPDADPAAPAAPAPAATGGKKGGKKGAQQ